MHIPGLPPKQSLYDPEHEKDRHVIAFVGDIAMMKQESPKGYRGRSR
jgi:hypothetical protein